MMLPTYPNVQGSQQLFNQTYSHAFPTELNMLSSADTFPIPLNGNDNRMQQQINPGLLANNALLYSYGAAAQYRPPFENHMLQQILQQQFLQKMGQQQQSHNHQQQMHQQSTTNNLSQPPKITPPTDEGNVSSNPSFDMPSTFNGFGSAATNYQTNNNFLLQNSQRVSNSSLNKMQFPTPPDDQQKRSQKTFQRNQNHLKYQLPPQTPSPPLSSNTLTPKPTPPPEVVSPKHEISQPNDEDSVSTSDPSIPTNGHCSRLDEMFSHQSHTPSPEPTLPNVLTPKVTPPSDVASPQCKIEVSRSSTGVIQSPCRFEHIDLTGYVHHDAFMRVISSPSYDSRGRLKQFRCKNCQHVSQTKSDHWKHLRDHIPESKQIRCPHCTFITTLKHFNDYHHFLHTGEKPLGCSQCMYRCANQSMLNSHMKSHSSLCQYKCGSCDFEVKHCHTFKKHLIKHNHQPGLILNRDGTVSTTPIDVYGRRRGPRSKPGNNAIGAFKDNHNTNIPTTANVTPTSSKMINSLSSEMIGQTNFNEMQQLQIKTFMQGFSNIEGELKAQLFREFLKQLLLQQQQQQQRAGSTSILLNQLASLSSGRDQAMSPSFSPGALDLTTYDEYQRSPTRSDVSDRSCTASPEALNLSTSDEFQISPNRLMDVGGAAYYQSRSDSREPTEGCTTSDDWPPSPTRMDEDPYISYSQFNNGQQNVHKIARNGNNFNTSSILRPLQKLTSTEHNKTTSLDDNYSATPSRNNTHHNSQHNSPSIITSTAMVNGANSKEQTDSLRTWATPLTSHGANATVNRRKRALTSRNETSGIQSPAPSDTETPSFQCEKYPNTSSSYIYECLHCGIGFKDESPYSLHMAFHNNTNVFKCNKCGMKFEDRITFNTHIALAPHSSDVSSSSNN